MLPKLDDFVVVIVTWKALCAIGVIVIIAAWGRRKV